MLGHHGRQVTPNWMFTLFAALLVVLAGVIIYAQSGNIEWRGLGGSGAVAPAPVRALPSVATLRDARSEFTGAYVPESTMGTSVASVTTLRMAQPGFTGAAVPESRMGAGILSVDILRAAKPDFVGGAIPESTMLDSR